MRINIGCITRHAGIVEIMLIGSDARARDKIYMVTKFIDVIPRVARLNHLVVPSRRRSWVQTSCNQRTACYPRLVEGMVHLANFKGIACAKVQVYLAGVNSTAVVSDRVRCVAQNPTKF